MQPPPNAGHWTQAHGPAFWRVVADDLRAPSAEYVRTTDWPAYQVILLVNEAGDVVGLATDGRVLGWPHPRYQGDDFHEDTDLNLRVQRCPLMSRQRPELGGRSSPKPPVLLPRGGFGYVRRMA